MLQKNKSDGRQVKARHALIFGGFVQPNPEKGSHEAREAEQGDLPSSSRPQTSCLSRLPGSMSASRVQPGNWSIRSGSTAASRARHMSPAEPKGRLKTQACGLQPVRVQAGRTQSHLGSLPTGYSFIDPVLVLTSLFSIRYSLFPQLPSPIPPVAVPVAIPVALSVVV